MSAFETFKIDQDLYVKSPLKCQLIPGLSDCSVEGGDGKPPI